jgi:DNA modification methylase
MTWQLIRGDARHVSDLLEPASVDLIITSPPYFALRSYRDECEACEGTGEARPGVERKSQPRLQNNNGTGSSTLNHGRGGAAYEAGIQATQANASDGCRACNGSGRSHFDGQLGSEPTPTEYVDNLIACTADWLKVLRPGGSIFVNLGDKRSGAGGPGGDYNPGGLRDGQPRIGAADYWSKMSPANNRIPAKSLMGLPWRYALRCVDQLGLILRADIIWHKPNGLPESVTDRVRQSHEYWFHLTREPRYFAAIDEIREPHADTTRPGGITHRFSSWEDRKAMGDPMRYGEQRQISGGYEAETPPLGKLPGSVWTYNEDHGLVGNVLAAVKAGALEPDEAERILLGAPGAHEYWFHLTREARYFAAVDEIREPHTPQWGPIDRPRGGLNMSDGRQSTDVPAGVGRMGGTDVPNPLGKLPGSVWTIPSEPLTVPPGLGVDHFAAFPTEWPRRLILGWSPSGWCQACGEPRRAVVVDDPDYAATVERGRVGRSKRWGDDGGSQAGFRWEPTSKTSTILGYSCACPDTTAPTRPSVVLDPFAGTGTTIAVAHHLGRHGIGIDLSADYLRLAEWRCHHDRALETKAKARSGLPAPPIIPDQLTLFNGDTVRLGLEDR